jgi:hypothetical protein
MPEGTLRAILKQADDILPDHFKKNENKPHIVRLYAAANSQSISVPRRPPTEYHPSPACNVPYQWVNEIPRE